jgi:hypothetical protein
VGSVKKKILLPEYDGGNRARKNLKKRAIDVR